mgnify:FL=1
MDNFEKQDFYHYEFRFHGRVQGVGFRYTAFHASSSVGATGWVKNEWDGTVLMQLQGNSAQIATVLKQLNNAMFIQIDEIEKKQIDVIETEKSFSIK